MNTFQSVTALVLTTLIIAMSQPASAAEDSPDLEQKAMDAAVTQLKETIEGISGDFFLREQKLDNGRRLLQVIWEMNGETSKITLEIRPLGQYDKKPVFGLLAYTMVSEVDSGSMPPAVIKAVATRNERTMLGYFSMPEKFDTVYMNMTTPSDTLTSSQLWMICAWLHKNRIEFRSEINSILKATG